MRGDRRFDDRAGGLRKNYRRVIATSSRPLARELRRQAVGKRDTGTRDDDEMGEPENLAPPMPRRKPEERIGADDEREISSGILVAQRLEGGDRIAAARASDLPGIDFETGMARNRELDHGEPVRSRYRRCGSVRRIAGGNEANGGQRERLAQFAREFQMAAMNRIERAAENAEYGLRRGAQSGAYQWPTNWMLQATKSRTPALSGTRFLPASTPGPVRRCGADSGRSGG